jgi:hypothetical protein
VVVQKWCEPTQHFAYSVTHSIPDHISHHKLSDYEPDNVPHGVIHDFTYHVTDNLTFPVPHDLPALKMHTLHPGQQNQNNRFEKRERTSNY